MTSPLHQKKTAITRRAEAMDMTEAIQQMTLRRELQNSEFSGEKNDASITNFWNY
jgi:hypothetical protein